MTNKKTERREAMGRDPIWLLIRRFSGPAVISMTVASSYNLVDTLFVGQLGPAALAAMSVTFPLTLSFVAIISGTAVGVTSLISRSIGAGDDATANQTACNGLTLCFILSAIITIVCLPNLKLILPILGADQRVIQFASDYLLIIISGVIVSYLMMIISNIIRADGNPFVSSSISILTSCLNIILDPILIFGVGPIPGLGITGAAIATVTAQSVGVLIFSSYIFSGKTNFKYKTRYFLPRISIISRIYKVGVASIVRSGLQFISMGIINKIAATYGVSTLATVGVLFRIARFVQMPVLGLGQGIIPLIGVNFGAQNIPRLSEIIKKATSVGLLWSCACWILIQLFRHPIIKAFNGNPEFITVGYSAAGIYFMAIFLMGIQMIPGFFFQGIGRGLPATMISACRQALFLVPLVLILPGYFGVNGLWLAYPITDIAVTIIGLIWIWRELKKHGVTLFSR